MSDQRAGVTPPAPYAAQPKTNVLSIVSLVASILGFLWVLPIIGSLAGVICGHISLSQLKTSGEQGRGMALAGTIIGWVSLALTVIGVIVILTLVGLVRATGSQMLS